MHRDISVRNLMTRKRGDRIYGVLNDFDLATHFSRTEASSKQRTGTQPFMAIDLLKPNPPGHLYRHDLESFFYVLVWIIVRFHNGRVIETRPLQEWEDSGRDVLSGLKSGFLLTYVANPTANYGSLFDWADRLKQIFMAGYASLAQFQAELKRAEATRSPSGLASPFDFNTLGDNITFDKFQEILTGVI